MDSSYKMYDSITRSIALVCKELEAFATTIEHAIGLHARADFLVLPREETMHEIRDTLYVDLGMLSELLHP
jgi:hypothetical protein